MAICLFNGQFQPGQVQVFTYDEKKGDWSKKGNDILVEIGLVFFKYIEINSAGNQIVESGLNKKKKSRYSIAFLYYPIIPLCR